MCMFSAGSVADSLCGLYHDGIHEADYAPESVEAMLNMIDFRTLAQALRHNAAPVHAFFSRGSSPGLPNYRGRDIFGQPGALLYAEEDEDEPGVGCAWHGRELWMLGSGQLVTTSCLSLTFLFGPETAYGYTYREQKGYPWGSGLRLDLEDLTEELRKLCLPVYQGKVPLYEL